MNGHMPALMTSQQSLQPATLIINLSTHITDQAHYDTLRSPTPALSDTSRSQPISVTHLEIDLDAPSVHAMRPHSTPEHHQFNSISDSRLTVTNATPLDSAPGSVPEVSPDQSRKKYTSTSPHGRGGGHGGHAEASTAPVAMLFLGPSSVGKSHSINVNQVISNVGVLKTVQKLNHELYETLFFCIIQQIPTKQNS